MATPTTAHSRGGVLVALLHELVRAADFTCYADLLEALKTRAAGLRIRYDGPAIHDAVRQVEHSLGRSIVTATAPDPGPFTADEKNGAPLSHHDAVELLDALGVQRLLTMAAVRRLSPSEMDRRRWRDDQRKAYHVVQQAILKTAHHVAALEDLIEADQHCTSTETEEGNTMTDPIVVAIGVHQLNWIDEAHTHATVRLKPTGTDVISVQPDGRIETRKEGTRGPYEDALVLTDRLIYAPEGVEGNVFILPYTSVLP